MFGDRTAGDIEVCAPTGLVGKHHTQAGHDGLILRLVRPHDAGQIVAVGYRYGAFARRHRPDLVGVAALGRTGHVIDQTFEPKLGFSFAKMFQHGAKQRQVVGVGSRPDAQSALVFWICQRLIGVKLSSLNGGFVVHHNTGSG